MEIAFQSNLPRRHGRGVKSKDKFYKNRNGGERHRAVLEIHRWISYPSMYPCECTCTRAHRRTYRRTSRIRVRTNTMWSTLILARAAPFVLKLEVTKRILTSLATSFYSPAFRHNVQRGFSMAATSARRREEGRQKKKQERVAERGLRDEQEREYEKWRGKSGEGRDERAPWLITNKCPC